MLVDPTRHQTFEYAQKQLEKVPKNMDVLLLISFRDLYSRRVVSEEDVEQFMRTQPANVKCIEASLMVYKPPYSSPIRLLSPLICW
jgi:hypothetical protein